MSLQDYGKHYILISLWGSYILYFLDSYQLLSQKLEANMCYKDSSNWAKKEVFWVFELNCIELGIKQ